MWFLDWHFWLEKTFFEFFFIKNCSKMSASGGKVFLRNKKDIDFNKVGIYNNTITFLSLLFISYLHFSFIFTFSFHLYISFYLYISYLHFHFISYLHFHSIVTFHFIFSFKFIFTFSSLLLHNSHVVNRTGVTYLTSFLLLRCKRKNFSLNDC